MLVISLTSKIRESVAIDRWISVLLHPPLRLKQEDSTWTLRVLGEIEVELRQCHL